MAVHHDELSQSIENLDLSFSLGPVVDMDSMSHVSLLKNKKHEEHHHHHQGNNNNNELRSSLGNWSAFMSLEDLQESPQPRRRGSSKSMAVVPPPPPTPCPSVSSSSSTCCSSTSCSCTLVTKREHQLPCPLNKDENNDRCSSNTTLRASVASCNMMVQELNQSIDELDLSLTIGHVDDVDYLLDVNVTDHRSSRDAVVDDGKTADHCGGTVSHHHQQQQQPGPCIAASTTTLRPSNNIDQASPSSLNKDRDGHPVIVAEQLLQPQLQQQQQQQRLQPALYTHHITNGRRTNILNDYTILPTILGHGCYGVVRECVRTTSNNTTISSNHSSHQSYAVKSIEKAQLTRPHHLRREIDLLSSMNHPSIIRLVDVYEDMYHVHIITELCSGGELFDRIQQRYTSCAATSKGCFSERTSARIIKSLLSAVEYLHSNGIIHRDIKPENILLCDSFFNEDNPTIKLIDFGLAKRHRHGIDRNLSKFRGTIYYMSPELLQCSYSSPTDVWSVGVIAYILLAGYPPFDGDSDVEIYASIAKGRVEFPSFMGWEEKSVECIDFIRAVLRKDAGMRLGAREALSHPWIVGMTGSYSE